MERSCRNLWMVFWKDSPYFDRCYFGQHLIDLPEGMKVKIEWV